MKATRSRWVRSEDAGHGAGALLLDMPAGLGHWSVRKANGRRWVAALVKNGLAVWSREFSTRREAVEFAEADAAAGQRWPTIRNCNFSSRHDDRGRHVREAILAADRGCEDCDLIGALDDLESTLADHAEDGSEESMRLCREAEEAVEAALLAINAAFDKAD